MLTRAAVIYTFFLLTKESQRTARTSRYALLTFPYANRIKTRNTSDWRTWGDPACSRLDKKGGDSLENPTFKTTRGALRWKNSH